MIGLSNGLQNASCPATAWADLASEAAVPESESCMALPCDRSANGFELMKKRKTRLTNSEHREISIAAVLSAAEFLFVTQGYHGTTTEKIGELAGLTKGSVYFYYGTKEGVLLELLKRVHENILIPIVQLMRDDSRSPVERITGFLGMTEKTALEHPGSMLLPILVSIELAGTELEAARRVSAGYNRVAKEIRNVLDLGQASGAVRSDLSSGDMARLLISICDGMMLECLRQNLRIDVQRLVRALRAVILSGLQGESVSPTDLVAMDGPSVLEVLSGKLQHHR